MSNKIHELKPGEVIINPSYTNGIYDHVKHCDDYWIDKRQEEEKAKGETENED